MIEQFLRNIQIIKSAISERKLVVFAGAGVSMDAGVPAWSELITELKADIDIPSNESDFLRIAQLYYNERGRKEFIDRIREILNHKKIRYNEIHKALFDLNPEHIITTNFDDLLEQVIKSKAYPFSVIKKDGEFPYARNTKLLVKMHGDMDEGNLVIKEDDYLEYGRTHPLIEGFIKGIFATKVVLFVGYSFSDLNLKILLQGIRNILEKDFQNAYLLSVDEEFHPSQREYLRNKGVTVINYYDSGKISGNDYIYHYLFDKKNILHNTVPNKNETLSTRGLRLYYLLQFISNYNAFADSIDSNDALTQVYKSLERFKSIRVLPPKFLSNLYPFNKSDSYIHNYKDYILGSNNEKIVKFFLEEIDSQSFELRDQFFNSNNISFHRREEMNRKLKYVLTKLNYSSIFYFGRTESTDEAFDHPKKFTQKIYIAIPTKRCSCLMCKFQEFDVKGFLGDLSDHTITETSDLQSDMLTAYSHYKAGSFRAAIDQFDEIGNKAWQIEDYIMYFIAQHNAKTLRNLFKWDFDVPKTETKKAILQRIENLDLDKLMFQVPKLNDDVYKLLKIIRDDEILISAERKINTTYDKIVETYEHYRRSGTLNGPYYPQQIISELLKVYFFYTYNYIVADEYTEFKNVFSKGIRALFISNATDKKYQARFTELNAWIIRLILLYGDDQELKKIINQHPAVNFTIQPSEVSNIFKILVNLLDSFIAENSFLGRSVYLSKEITKQSTNFFFQQRLRNTLHNSFIVFSLIEIDADQGKSLTRRLIDFLSVEDALTPASNDYFNLFLKRLIAHFTFDDIIKLLQVSETKSFLLSSDKFFQIVAKTLKKHHPEKKIDDIDLITKLINSSLDSHQGKHERGFMYLWEASNPACRNLIAERLKNDLSNHFYSEDYFQACSIDVVEPSEFYSNILNEIEGRIPKEFRLEGERSFYFNLTSLSFIYMIYNKDLLHEEIPFNSFEELPDYAQFYFRPYSFDYSKFNVDWLIPLKSKHIFEHLKKIPEIKVALKNRLKQSYDKNFSEIYTRFFISEVQ